MATHKSAIKRDKQNEARRLRNKAYKTKAKNLIKEVRLAIADKKTEDARKALNKATSILQKIQSKGVMHKNTAARNVSRLSVQINRLSATASGEGKG